jgi:hypothetical protein
MTRLLLVTLALAGAAGLAMRGPAAAQEGEGNGLAVVIQAGRYAVNPGQAVGLAAGLQNRGRETIRLAFTCAPPVDFEVLSATGDVVWHQTSECGGDDLEISIAPGQTRWWEASWPGASELGTYYAYATFHLFPREAAAGPVSILVAEGDHEPPPRETERPRETEQPRETDRPRETEDPHETEPPPTDHPPVDYPDEAFPIADWDGSQTHPDVDGRREPGDCQQLVIWHDTDEHGVFGRFVEGQWRGDDFRISGETGVSGAPRVAYNPVRRLWLVVWASPSDQVGLEIRGRYVQCGGTEGPVFTIGGHPANDHSPAVAAGGEHFVVTWVRDGEQHSVINAAIISGTNAGGLIGLAEGNVSEPAVACRAHLPCFVVWTRGEGGGRDVLGRRWWPDRERADEVLEVASSEAAEYDASIAAGDGELPYLVTYTRAADRSAVYGRRVHASGEIVVGDALQLSGEDTAHSSDVSPAGGGWNVVWVEGDVSPAVRGRYVGGGEGLLPGPIANISAAGAPTDGHPAAASVNTGTALAVWDVTGDDIGADIWGRFVHWPGGEGRVVLLGRVAGSAAAAVAAEAGAITITVERVLEGTFPCTEARVYYAADTQLPPDLSPGARLYVIGEQAQTLGLCSLQVASPGTLIAAAGPERLFAPAVLKQPE